MQDTEIDPEMSRRLRESRKQAETEFEDGLLQHIHISARSMRQAKKIHSELSPDMKFDEEVMREEMIIQERQMEIMSATPFQNLPLMQNSLMEPMSLNPPPGNEKATPSFGWGSVVAMWIAAIIGFMAFFPLGIVLAVVAVVMSNKLKK